MLQKVLLQPANKIRWSMFEVCNCIIFVLDLCDRMQWRHLLLFTENDAGVAPPPSSDVIGLFSLQDLLSVNTDRWTHVLVLLVWRTQVGSLYQSVCSWITLLLALIIILMTLMLLSMITTVKLQQKMSLNALLSLFFLFAVSWRFLLISALCWTCCIKRYISLI